MIIPGIRDFLKWEYLERKWVKKRVNENCPCLEELAL